MSNFIDLFAGIGGFRRGMEMNSFKCVMSCEINDSARQSYAAIHGENYDDILLDVTDLNKIENKLKGIDVELVCGGFPCQPFSRSGKREGFKDKNKGSLFFSTMDIVNHLKPKTVLLENVKGLLSIGEVVITPDDEPNIEVDKGSTFKDILIELNESGYNVEWQVINSAHFCSQKRERVFIHAEKKSDNFKAVFPLPTIDVQIIDLSISDNLLSFIELLKEAKGPDENPLIDVKSLIRKYKLCDGKLLDEYQKEFVYGKVHPFNNWGIMINGDIYTTKINHRLPRVFEYTLSDLLLPDAFIEKNYYCDILSDVEVDKQRIAKGPKVWKTGNKMGRMSFPDKKDRPSRTLTAGSTGRELMVIECFINGEKKYRKLTALECLRLQGFADEDYKKMIEAGVSNNQIKKQAGNAVTVNVINEIGNRLRRE